MKTITKVLSVVLLTIIATPLFDAAEPGDPAIAGSQKNTQESVLAIRAIIELLSSAYESESQLSPEKYRENSQKLMELSSRLPEQERIPIQYHRARLLALAGDESKALIILDELIAEKAPLPEALWLKIQVDVIQKRKFNQTIRMGDLDLRLGMLLPLSGWSSLYDGMLQSREAAKTGQEIINDRWLPIPSINKQKLLTIASLFEQMQMKSYSANAYREAIYGAFAPPWLPKNNQDNGWLSPVAAKEWLSTAQLDAAMGRPKWALEAVLMAVSSDAQLKTKALELVKNGFSTDKEISEPKPNLEMLKQIAQLYRECDLHPRAIEALNLAAKIKGVDVSKLLVEVAEEWGKRVAYYSRGRESTCFLFGYKVAATPIDQIKPATFNYGDD